MTGIPFTKDSWGIGSNSNATRYCFYVLKVLVLAIFAVVLFYQIRDSFGHLNERDWHIDGIKWGVLLPVAILTVINWSMEGLKWSICLDNSRTFIESTRDVLAGHALAFVSPMGLGDYVGRYWRTGKVAFGISAKWTFWSSISQNLVHLLTGLLALFFLRSHLFNGMLVGSLSFLAVVLAVICVGWMCRDQFLGLLRKKKWFKQEWLILGKSGRHKLIQVLGVSMIRYAVYAIQYALVFWMFGLEGNMLVTLGLISIFFLIQSGIPLSPLLKGLARLEIAILIFSYHFDNEFLILCSALCIWIMNVIFPALVGMIDLMKKRNFDLQAI